MHSLQVPSGRRLRIAVVGAGISGLASAWLLSKRHAVTLFEAAPRLGGHSCTADWAGTPVDTGFIVYNEQTYPNLTALFRHLDVPTEASDMSFAVSMDDGRLEYAGTNLFALFAQRSNLFRPRFWSMLRGVMRFFREAPRDLDSLEDATLEQYLDAQGHGRALREDFLYPMAAAIWSTPAADIRDYPAAAFLRFFHNHGLLRILGQPIWRTVSGGSRVYVERLAKAFQGEIRVASPVSGLRRGPDGVSIINKAGEAESFDHVVIAAHADQALAMLEAPTVAEREALGAFGYCANRAVLHTDPRAMPSRRAAWASWNYMTSGDGADRRLSVTYWMNRLQNIEHRPPVFVTLNPLHDIPPSHIIQDQVYEHPRFNTSTLRMQRRLWALQGANRTWFCGAYFGAGFHEDGLQAALAVAEALGGEKRPWTVAGESDRVFLPRPEPEWALA